MSDYLKKGGKMPKPKPKVIIVKKTASVSYGRTVNLSPNTFEFDRFDAGVGVEFSHDIEGTNLDVDTRETLDDLMQDVFEFVEDEVKRVRKS